MKQLRLAVHFAMPRVHFVADASIFRNVAKNAIGDPAPAIGNREHGFLRFTAQSIMALRPFFSFGTYFQLLSHQFSLLPEHDELPG